MKKVYNENKTTILTEKDYDLNLGYFKDDIIINHIPEVKEVKEVSHLEVIKEYPNGGKDVETVVDVPGVRGIPAHDEEEQILIYVPYTEEQLLVVKEKKKSDLVEEYIREKYSLNDELAILRQRDSKPEEFSTYNEYAEQCKARALEEINKIF